MAPRAGPSTSISTSTGRRKVPQKSRPSFVLSTQAVSHPRTTSHDNDDDDGNEEQGGSSGEEDDDDEDDPLAMSPLRRPSPLTSTSVSTSKSLKPKRRRSTDRQHSIADTSDAVHAPSSSSPGASVRTSRTRTPRTRATIRTSGGAGSSNGATTTTRGGGRRKTRAALREEREQVEMNEGDLVPPSEDEEYEAWKESRMIRSVHTENPEKAGDEEEDGSAGGGHDHGAGSGRIGTPTKRPKKPDKDKERTPYKLNKSFRSFFSSPYRPSRALPSSSSASTHESDSDRESDLEIDTKSGATSPTQPISFSQDDDDDEGSFPLHKGRRWLSETGVRGYKTPSTSASAKVYAKDEALLLDSKAEVSLNGETRSNAGFHADTGEEASKSTEDAVMLPPSPEPFLRKPERQSQTRLSLSRSPTPQTLPMAEIERPETGVFETMLVQPQNDTEILDSGPDASPPAGPLDYHDSPRAAASQPDQSTASAARSTDPENLMSFDPPPGPSMLSQTPSFLQSPDKRSTSLRGSPSPEHDIQPSFSNLLDLPPSPRRLASPAPEDRQRLLSQSSASSNANANDVTIAGLPASVGPKFSTPSRPSSPAAPLSPIFAAVAQPAPAPSPPAPVHMSTPPIADPALEQFRGARTFRTRTVLQLQPYTKERQNYEAQLRKGGLKKGKKAIAPSKEVTQEDDEDEAQGGDESSELSALEDSPERIVIGNTPPPPVPRKVRAPKELVDADYDEYFFEHGTVADEEDPEVAESLQKIARRRLKLEKEEKRKRREAEKERKQFESLMRGMNGNNSGSGDGESEGEKGTLPVRPNSTRTPRPKTYGSKSKSRPPLAPSLPDPSLASRAIPPISPAKSHTGTPTASFRTALSGTGDMDMDIGYGQPLDGPFMAEMSHIPPSPLDRNDSFFINDLPPSPVRHHAVQSSPSDSESDSAGSLAPDDPRKKIARRMMPAAMLRRLEAEAAEKERRKAEKKRRDQQRITESPMRPGRAVVRSGGGHGGLGDLDSLFSGDEADETLEETPSARAAFHREATNSFERPIVVSDGGDSSSEAAEDNQTEHTLARLHRGDFEGIVAGHRSRQAENKRRNATSRKNRDRARRPALGLLKRVRAPSSPIADYEYRTLRQTRIDFPLAERSPLSPVKGKKRKQSVRPGAKQRPAIRLDDHVIFATVDFEFDSDHASPRPTVKQKQAKLTARPFARTSSAANLTPQKDSLDAGIGKARSWANFDRFPIDFDITPLPSGLYCSPSSIPGSGKLEALTKYLRRAITVDPVIEFCTDYSIEMRFDMTPGGIQAVVPLLFDAMYRQMMAIVNDENSELSTAPLVFLGLYMSARAEDIDETRLTLRTELEEAIGQLNVKLEELDLRSKSSREARSSLLDLRWSLFELALRISPRTEDGSTLVTECAVALIRQLLSFGFDKTIRPLKLIMRGESDSGEITDQTITIWISVIQASAAWDDHQNKSTDDIFLSALNSALDHVFHLDQVGPIAAERIWFLIFGLCALSQFDSDGRISSIFVSSPRWMLVRRAVGLIKVAFDEDAEKRAQLDQLQGRDRYVKVMMARCVRLSCIWKWHFDRESFSVATRDLGIIFKDRQYRNLPTEPPVDYPEFITRFDMSLTAAEDTKRETAFELYLRLVCVAASDIISSAQTLKEAQQAEKDVQRLVMSIIPVSAVKFNRLFPPSPKELGQLVNRYSTMIAACYFSPSLLSYLLANSKKWSPFEEADFESRQICIRGLMYLAVARRHHQQPLEPVVNRLAEIMGCLQAELEVLGGPSAPTLAPNRKEIERTMVLVVTCFRMMIKHHSFDPDEQIKAVYPDPCLLHESWTIRIFDLELVRDLKCGLEVVATIQAFLDTRTSALPRLARQRREAKESHSESMDEFGSLGIDFTAADVLALGGDVGAAEDPTEKQDGEFALIIENVISPKIYRLLSDMLPPVRDEEEEAADKEHQLDRQVFISKLTKCWSDCAAVLVVEHQKLDWSTFISPFGRQSWARIGDERGRVQVGLYFMLNVAHLDPACFGDHQEDFISLFFQVIGTDKLTVEHKYLSALLVMPGALDYPLLSPLGGMECLQIGTEMDRTKFMDIRSDVLRAIFAIVPDLLRSSQTPASFKSFIYRCINLFVSSLVSHEKSIDPAKVIHRESYHAFTSTIIRDLRRLAGEYITPLSVPGLKHFS
ncbi:hypothetical protein I317_01823 [Kwoniella heveanensis CBS 569]|nr:hypothetical protein I317_01823 [Kwoniella heveanensis CBS 569]